MKIYAGSAFSFFVFLDAFSRSQFSVSALYSGHTLTVVSQYLSSLLYLLEK